MSRELHTQSDSTAAALRASLLRVVELATLNVLDVERLNGSRRVRPLLDCEADRVVLAVARNALAAINRGDRQTLVRIASRMRRDYAKGLKP